MPVVRRRLAWIVSLWLVAQIAGLTAAPFALCCKSGPAMSGGDDEEKCCPGLLPGQVCPMHHTREGGKTCKMRSACSNTDSALVSLAGGLGVLPSLTASVNAFEYRGVLTTITPAAVSRANRPDAPPPRS